MSMSTHITGVRDLDGKFAKMAAIKTACEAAGVQYPLELNEYFGNFPGESIEYLKREMEEIDLGRGGAVAHRQEDATDIFELDLSKLPPEVKKIRFKNSY